MISKTSKSINYMGKLLPIDRKKRSRASAFAFAMLNLSDIVIFLDYRQLLTLCPKQANLSKSIFYLGSWQYLALKGSVILGCLVHQEPRSQLT